MSLRLRTLLVTSLAVAGLALGLGTASADEPEDGPSGSGNPLDIVFDTANDVTRPVLPPVVDEVIGGLYY